MELAELEGLHALIPHLALEVDQTTSVVQRKNQLLCEKMAERAKLQQDVEALSGVNALAAGAAPPYSEQLLALLSEEYAAVQQLQEEVEGSGLALAEEIQATERETSVVTAETSNIHVEKDGLMRQFQAGTARIEQLHARSEQIQASQEQAERRTEELRAKLGRGDEIMSGRLRKAQRQLVVKRQVRDHRRQATAEITARHRAMKDQQIAGAFPVRPASFAVACWTFVRSDRWILANARRDASEHRGAGGRTSHTGAFHSRLFMTDLWDF